MYVRALVYIYIYIYICLLMDILLQCVFNRAEALTASTQKCSLTNRVNDRLYPVSLLGYK
jgi:hypothetical protein